MQELTGGTFEEIADERRHLADLLSGLTVRQLATQSPCSNGRSKMWLDT